MIRRQDPGDGPTVVEAPPAGPRGSGLSSDGPYARPPGLVAQGFFPRAPSTPSATLRLQPIQSGTDILKQHRGLLAVRVPDPQAGFLDVRPDAPRADARDLGHFPLTIARGRTPDALPGLLEAFHHPRPLQK
jgi:hypothetical protein